MILTEENLTTELNSFNNIIEEVNQLPLDTQEELIEIFQKNLFFEKRNRIIQEVKEGIEDYENGNIFRGSADEVFEEIFK